MLRVLFHKLGSVNISGQVFTNFPHTTFEQETANIFCTRQWTNIHYSDSIQDQLLILVILKNISKTSVTNETAHSFISPRNGTLFHKSNANWKEHNSLKYTQKAPTNSAASNHALPIPLSRERWFEYLHLFAGASFSVTDSAKHSFIYLWKIVNLLMLDARQHSLKILWYMQ